MMFDIVTFGSAVIDTFVYTDVSTRNNELHYPVGEKILIEKLYCDIGGGATNTAVGFARLGLKTGCITAVGDDNNGKNIRDLLKKEKITFLGPIKKGKPSGYSVILDSTEEDRTILTYKGVNNEISEKDIKPFKTRWVYCSSVLGKSFKTQKKVIKKLYKHGVKVAFNPSSYHIKNEDLKELLKCTTILILNKEEGELLQKKYKVKGNPLYALHSLGPDVVVITDKHNPVKCVANGKEYNLTPRRIKKVVERTGAGDAFATGFVAGMLKEKPVIDCLKLGQQESESVIKYMGAKNKLLTKRL